MSGPSLQYTHIGLHYINLEPVLTGVITIIFTVNKNTEVCVLGTDHTVGG